MPLIYGNPLLHCRHRSPERLMGSFSFVNRPSALVQSGLIGKAELLAGLDFVQVGGCRLSRRRILELWPTWVPLKRIWTEYQLDQCNETPSILCLVPHVSLSQRRAVLPRIPDPSLRQSLAPKTLSLDQTTFWPHLHDLLDDRVVNVHFTSCRSVDGRYDKLVEAITRGRSRSDRSIFSERQTTRRINLNRHCTGSINVFGIGRPEPGPELLKAIRSMGRFFERWYTPESRWLTFDPAEKELHDIRGTEQGCQDQAVTLLQSVVSMSWSSHWKEEFPNVFNFFLSDEAPEFW